MSTGAVQWFECGWPRDGASGRDCVFQGREKFKLVFETQTHFELLKLKKNVQQNPDNKLKRNLICFKDKKMPESETWYFRGTEMPKLEGFSIVEGTEMPPAQTLMVFGRAEVPS